MPVNKNALLRYYAIDACLSNSMRPYPDLEKIRQRVMQQLDGDISVSMINKDLAQMRDMYAAPIKYDKIKKGYCYATPGYSIKRLPLSEEEITALDYSTALLQQLKGSRIFDQFETAINRLIEGYRVSKLIGKSEKQLIQVEEPVATGGNEWLEMILQAIVSQTTLEIEYAKWKRTLCIMGHRVVFVSYSLLVFSRNLRAHLQILIGLLSVSQIALGSGKSMTS